MKSTDIGRIIIEWKKTLYYFRQIRKQTNTFEWKLGKKTCWRSPNHYFWKTILKKSRPRQSKKTMPDKIITCQSSSICSLLARKHWKYAFFFGYFVLRKYGIVTDHHAIYLYLFLRGRDRFKPINSGVWFWFRQKSLEG